MATKRLILAAIIALSVIPFSLPQLFWPSPAAAQTELYYDQDLGNYMLRPGPMVRPLLTHDEMLRRAQGGDPAAQYQIGLDSLNGEEVAQNFSQARYWFDRAARQGYPMAQFKLGDMLDTIQYGMLDRVQAYLWYSLAYANGVALAKSRRLHLADHMDPSEIRRAQAMQANWRPVKENPNSPPPAKR